MDIKTILRKIEETETPKVNKVAVAYSGGLDSSLSIELLRRKYQAKEILPITIDVGQGVEEVQEGRRKAKVLKIKPLFFDLRKELTEVWIARAIQANSDYLGYPVSTSMTRQIVAKKVADVALHEGCDAILEGSSGKGNDQYRMHNVFKMFAPKLKILVPVMAPYEDIRSFVALLKGEYAGAIDGFRKFLEGLDSESFSGVQTAYRDYWLALAYYMVR